MALDLLAVCEEGRVFGFDYGGYEGRSSLAKMWEKNEDLGGVAHPSLAVVAVEEAAIRVASGLHVACIT